MDVPVTEAPAAVRGPEIIARLDRLPRMARAHWLWLPLLGLLSLGDTADLNVLAYAAPAMRSHWGLSIGQIGNLTSLSMLGMFLGALIGGRLSDRFGRKRLIIAGSVLYAAASILCGVASNFAVLGVFRTLSGIGIQTVIGVLIVYVAEMYPARVRGRCQAGSLAIGLLGVPLIAFLAKLIIPLSPDAWRWVFVLGAVGLIPAIIGLFLLPESARWLVTAGRPEEADRIVNRLEGQYHGALPPAGPVPVTASALAPAPMASVPGRRLADLFRGSLRRATIVTTLTTVFGIVAFYGFSSWVPTLLVARGYSVGTALTISTVLSIAPPFGALAAMLVTDRWERKYVVAGFSVAIAVLMVIFALTGALWLTIAAGFLISLFLQSSAVTLYAYMPDVFPTRLRGFGSGLSNGIGRLAAVGGAALVAAIYAAAGFGAVFLTTAAFSAVTALVIAAFGENTRDRSLR